MTIGEKIRAARNAKNLTVEELSSRSGVDDKLIEKYEDNQIRPRYSTLNKLADALDVKPVELYNDNAEPLILTPSEELFGEEFPENEPTVDLLHKFVEQLKDLRLYNVISQEELAENIGVSADKIAQYEREEAAPDIITLNSLANYFKVSTDYILGKTSFSKNREDFQVLAKSIERLAELHVSGELSDELYTLCRDAVVTECAFEICEM